jgi:hypothetical protein
MKWLKINRKPLVSNLKKTLSTSQWKQKKIPAQIVEGEVQFHYFLQNKNPLIAFFNVSSPIRNAVLRIVGFILPVILNTIGIILIQRQEYYAGIILLAIALPLLLLATQFIKNNPPVNEEFSVVKPYIGPGLFFLGAVAFTVILIFNITNSLRTSKLDYLATTEWALSILSLTISILWVSHWKPIRLQDIEKWVKANKVEFGLAAAVIIAGLIIRTIGLTEHPYPWSGDEASVGLDAIRIINGEVTNLFNTSWSGQPNTSFLPTAFSMIIFGKNFFAIKMMSAITGILSIMALYMLAREWFGSEIALIASGFLVAYPYHIQFSRIGVDNIFDSLMAPLVIWLIFRAVRIKSLPSYLLAGIASGLTIYTYVGTRLVLAMAIGTIAYIAITQKNYLKTNPLQLGTYLAGLTVTISPITTFFLKRPELFMTRFGQESIFFNGWLSAQTERIGLRAWEIVLNQFLRTASVFFAQNAYSNFLNFDRPYLTFLGAIFFLIGLAVAFRHFFDQRYFILQMWFWSILILGGALTMNPPAHTRLIMTIPATGIFIALGASQVSKVLLRMKLKQRWIYGLNFLLIFTLAYQNLSFYFGTYYQERYFKDASAELGMETGLQLQNLGEDYDYYLFGLPRVFARFPSTEFLAPNNPKYDVNTESIQKLSINKERGSYFVAIPENQKLLQQIIKKYPGGSFEIITREMTTEVLYYAYILPPRAAYTP